VGRTALGAGVESALPQPALPNQRLQRAGARGSIVAWLGSATEVMQALCGWRAVARR
jgi:hypothetical protein